MGPNAEVAHNSFADEMLAREVAARRIAATEIASSVASEVHQQEIVAAECLVEVERLRCAVENENARTLVAEQTLQIARLTEQLELQRPQVKTGSDSPPPRAVPIEVGMVTPTPLAPMGRPVVKRLLADFRINLTVNADDYESAVQAGAKFDEVNGCSFRRAWI